MLKLQVITGSTRAGRNADPVLNWLLPAAKAHGAFDVELLDLRDWPLPMFQETPATVGDPAAPTYSDPLVKKWNAKIREADAYLLVTPEYNHSLPGVLKNAIDSVFMSFAFRHKAVALAGYSVGAAGGVRALEHLNQIMIETEASPVRTQILIPTVMNAFDANGQPVNPITSASLPIVLDDLAWLGNALKVARGQGEQPPPSLRLRMALAKK